MNATTKTTINVQEHNGIIFQAAKKISAKYPRVDFEDIRSEVILVVLEYTERYNAEKGTIANFIMSYCRLKAQQNILYKYVSFTYDNTEENGRERRLIDNVSMSASNEDSTSCIQDTKQALDGFHYMYGDNDNGNSEAYDIINESENLTEKEKNIVFLKYGITEDIPLTLEEIGQRFGITKQAIKKQLDNAEEKLFCNRKLKTLYND